MSHITANRDLDGLIRDGIPVEFESVEADAFCILSNAIDTEVGSITAGWEHFFSWLRVEDEKEKVDRTAIRVRGPA